MSNVRFAGRALAATGRILARRATRGPLVPRWTLRTELVQGLMRTVLDGVPDFGIDWMRELQATGGMRSAALDEVDFSAVDAGGVPAEWCVPKRRPDTERILVYYHGGGYVFGSVDSHRDLVARVAARAGARTLAVDYRLAPEHPFPAAHDDAFAAYRWALEQAGPGAPVGLGGDSAGGALCISTCIAARASGLAQPRAAALISPWTDPLADGGSMVSNDSTDICDRRFLVHCAETYLGGADAADPRTTPLAADLSGLPPLLVVAGEAETLRDQILAFEARARAAGVETELLREPGAFHVFQTAAAVIPEAAEATERIGAWLEKRLA